MGQVSHMIIMPKAVIFGGNFAIHCWEMASKRSGIFLHLTTPLQHIPVTLPMAMAFSFEKKGQKRNNCNVVFGS